MKIRIKGNSLRIRLTRPEIDFFGAEGYLEEKTNFGKTTLTYALKSKTGIVELSADFTDNKITMFIPEHLAKQWTTTEKVGYENEMEIGDGKKLFLLLEKDFKCLDNTTEDQSDNFENPLQVKIK
ncbi:MAG TPA: hypothetical protein VJY62_08505 [Bacteroidia bacterium]|nr:hypothetical protein [Bacteroidia bacterium]